jgi:hypothetical protein
VIIVREGGVSFGREKGEGVWLGGVAEQKTDFERERERERERYLYMKRVRV